MDFRPTLCGAWAERAASPPLQAAWSPRQMPLLHQGVAESEGGTLSSMTLIQMADALLSIRC